MNPLVTACLAALSWLPGSSVDTLPPGHTVHIIVPSGSRIAASPLGAMFERFVESQPDLANLHRYVAAVTGRDVDDMLEAALGGPLELGIYAVPPARDRGGAPTRRHLLASAQGSDARSVAEALDDVLVVLEGLGLSVRKRGYRGLEVVMVEREVSLCRIRDRLFIATQGDLLGKALDRQLDGDRSRSRTPRTGLAGFSLQFGEISTRDVQRLTGGTSRLQRQLSSPLLSVLLGETGEAVLSGGTVTGHVELTRGRIRIEASLPRPPRDRSWPDTLPPHRQGSASLPVDADALGVMHVERDLAAWWRHREELLPPEMQTQLARFDNQMSMLFSGGSLADDVFARIGSPLGIVVSRQHYQIEPEIRFPGACLVAPLKDAEDFAPELQVAFQTLIGLINAERGQQGEPPFLIETAREPGLLGCFAHILQREESVPPAEANLSPALAIVDDVVLIGTSTDQVRRLIAALRAGEFSAQEGDVAVSLDIGRVAALAADNRRALIAQNVLEKGTDPEQAAKEIDDFIGLLRHFDQVQLSLVHETGAIRAVAEVTLAAGGP